MLLVVRGCRGSNATFACGIEGHQKGDGLVHEALKTKCENGHVYSCECDTWVVPSGGIYYRGVLSSSLADYSGAVVSYPGGYSLPCGTRPCVGDVFVSGDYEYRYGCSYNNSWASSSTVSGWGVRVLDPTKDAYEDILNTVNGVAVTHLNSAFSNCTALTATPKLPDGAVDLSACFAGCTELSEVSMVPEGVKYIQNMFQNCVNLKKAPLLPQSVTDMTGTFRGCSSLVDIPAIPGCVNYMEGTFEGCSSLQVTPNIPVTVYTLKNTFAGCRSLTEPPEIPLDVVNLDGTFSGCTLLKTAPYIHDYVTSLNGTFRGCASLIKAPNIPESVIDMTATFDGCISMKGYVVIFAEPYYYQRCLAETKVDEILGTTKLKSEILATRRG